MDGEAFIRKAYESILKNDFAQAVQNFELAISLDPNNADYHYKLSITCLRNNNISKAIEHAREAARLDPRSETFPRHVQFLEAKELLVQAESYFSGGPDQLLMAAALLKQAIQLDSLSVEAYLLLGLAYSGLSEYADGIQAVREALKLDPGNAAASRLLQELEQKFTQYMHSTSE